MSELAPGWTSAPIDDLGELRLGKMLDKAKNQGLPAKYLRNINVRWFRFDLDDMHTLFASPAELKQLSVEDGDLFVCEGGEPGRCAVWRGGDNVFVYQKALHRFRSHGGMVPELLMYRLRYDAETGALSDAFTGTTIKHLTRESLARFKVPVPPLAEQKRIVDKLDALLARVGACRERLDRVPGILKRFRQSVLAAATSGELTREWREGQGRHGDVGVEHPDLLEEHGGWSSTLLPAAWRWMGFTECFDDETDSRRKLPQSEYEAKGEIAVVDQGDALVGGYTSRTDLASRVSLPAIVFGDHTRCVKFVDFPFVQGADGVKVLVPRAQVLVPQYAHLALQACQLPNKGYSRHMRFLRASFIPIPDLDEQLEIVRRAAALFSLVDRLGGRVRTVEARVARLAPSALAKAFRGELAPQDPNDEPASKLLARLRTRPTSAGNTGMPKRGGARGPRRMTKADTNMLTRKDVTPTHLTTILKERGSLTAEALWAASQLEIDDFYDQLKDEEARGLLRENRGDSPTAPRALEAAG